MEEKKPTAEEQKTGSSDILETIEQEMDQDVHPLLQKILDNIKPIGIAIVAIIAIVAVYAVSSSYRDKQHANAVSELGKILVLADPAVKAEKLASFIPSNKDLSPSAQLELASTLEESGDKAKAAETWNAIRQNSDPDIRVIAAMAEANLLVDQKEYVKAVDILTEAKKTAAASFGTQISNILAFAAEKAGKNDIAIAEYESIKAKSPQEDSAFLDYKINRLRAAPQS